MRTLRVPGLAAFFAFLVLGGCSGATSSASNPSPPDMDETHPAPEGEDYAGIVDDAESDEGLFTVHRSEDDVYFEIPADPHQKFCNNTPPATTPSAPPAPANAAQMAMALPRS